MKQYLEAGQIVGTHGIKGMTRVNAWSDSGEFLSQFKKVYLDKNGDNQLDIIKVQPHGNVVLIQFKNVDSIELAEKLRGKTIYIDRNDANLPDGRYFIDDLIGCTVRDVDTNKDLGVISDVSETGANDVWHIKNNDKEYLIPVIDDVVISVDISNEIIEIRPLKGIFEDED